MKRVLTLAFLFLCFQAQSQTADTLLKFKDVGWSLRLPRSFVLVSDKENEELTQNGLSAIEKSNDVKVNMDGLKTLLSASQGEFNYISATIQPFSPEDGDYYEVNEGVKVMLYKTFADQMEGGKIDTLSTTQNIDGINFSRFEAGVSMEGKKVMTMVMLFRLHKGFDFGITYVYIDDKAKNEIETMLRNSRFEK